MNKWTVVWRLVGIGWYFAFCLLLGAGVGYWLDHKFDTLPILTFVGLSGALGLSFFGFYRMVQPLMKEEQKKDGGKS
jgi:F0F1-type ATP synthase assembly protein I